MSLSTSSVATSVLMVPKGRHTYKIAVQTKCECHIELLSDSRFMLGPETEVLQSECAVSAHHIAHAANADCPPP